MLIILLSIALSSQIGYSQIPTVCANEESLRNLVCCPNDCGARDGHGSCINLGIPHNMTSNDVRGNWPHYFTRACNCTGNYSGVDCSRCKYGYYGTNCEEYDISPRRPIDRLTGPEWTKYIDILTKTRMHDSGYKVVLNQSLPGNVNINLVDIKLYDLYVWLHHFAAKDSECGPGDGIGCIKVDYAHESTGFPTWHRQHLLWIESEIQWMLKSQGESNYHTFRIHYWDWRRERRSHELFQMNKLGTSITNQNGQSQVSGDLVGDGWDTICWYNGSGNVTIPKGTICNPNIKTGPLLRCPLINDSSVCDDNKPNYWPTYGDVDNAINKQVYDTESFDKNATADSFRNFMEGFDNNVSIDECASNNLCICEGGGGGVDCIGEESSSPLQRRLHNAVHIIVGIGDFKLAGTLASNMKGVMADVAASPNDPVFINHHGMIDYILEMWLNSNRSRVYPDIPSERKGHQRDSFIVPFFPLFKHSDVFKEAADLGYSYEDPSKPSKPWIIVFYTIVAIICITFPFGIAIYNCYKEKTRSSYTNI